MKSQQNWGANQTSAPGPIFVAAEKLLGQLKESAQTIAKRAYECFEERGRKVGHDLEDWLRAEFEVTRRLPVEIQETDTRLIIRAEVPGFKPEDIKVSIEPKQIIISGRSGQKKEEETENMVFSEFQSQQFCRSLDLGAEVDPALATATLQDGVLELVVPKAAAREATNVEVKSA